MRHYSGWYYCTKSHWDGKSFDAKNLVTIEKHDDEYRTEDFKKLVDSKKVLDSVRFSYLEVQYRNDPEMLEYSRAFCQKDCYFLKPEVMLWLEENVKDTQKGEKGWCVGNDEYNSHDSETGFSLFFYRRKDALNFIKTWSVYKKPTETYNQNTYIAKKLDLKTNKLVVDKD